MRATAHFLRVSVTISQIFFEMKLFGVSLLLLLLAGVGADPFGLNKKPLSAECKQITQEKCGHEDLGLSKVACLWMLRDQVKEVCGELRDWCPSCLDMFTIESMVKRGRAAERTYERPPETRRDQKKKEEL